MVELLLIRHGETTDNINGVWAGWRDSPLSNYGMQQAEALANALSDKDVTAIYSSDLLRAKTTANALKSKQRNEHIVSIQYLTSLREQHFGQGEGKKFAKREQGLSLADHFSRGKFPALQARHEKFPGGESLDEVAQRAEIFIDVIFIPHLLQELDQQRPQVIAIVSHGLFLRELIAAVVRRDRDCSAKFEVQRFRWMKNTAWTRFIIEAKAVESGSATRELVVQVKEQNQDTHLLNLRRQKGGIGSMAHDPKQADIRRLFAKEPVDTKSTKAKPY